VEGGIVKRRRSLQRVTAQSKYPRGTVGTANVLSFPKVDTYYRITRSTTTFNSEGHTSAIHSWACEEESTFGTHTTSHKTWQEAMDYAAWCIRRAHDQAVSA
jgi:hypothetical protein